MAKSYDDGVRNGGTTADLKSIANTIQSIWNKLDKLPCAANTSNIASNKSTLAILTTLVTANIGMLVWLIYAVRAQ